MNKEVPYNELPYNESLTDETGRYEHMDDKGERENEEYECWRGKRMQQNG